MVVVICLTQLFSSLELVLVLKDLSSSSASKIVLGLSLGLENLSSLNITAIYLCMFVCTAANCRATA